MTPPSHSGQCRPTPMLAASFMVRPSTEWAEHGEERS